MRKLKWETNRSIGPLIRLLPFFLLRSPPQKEGHACDKGYRNQRMAWVGRMWDGMGYHGTPWGSTALLADANLKEGLKMPEGRRVEDGLARKFGCSQPN